MGLLKGLDKLTGVCRVASWFMLVIILITLGVIFYAKTIWNLDLELFGDFYNSISSTLFFLTSFGFLWAGFFERDSRRIKIFFNFSSLIFLFVCLM